MSTIDPPPRPAAVRVTERTTRWARIEPSIEGGELVLWRCLTTALLSLSVVAVILGMEGAAMLALMLLLVSLLIVDGQAPWWVRQAS